MNRRNPLLTGPAAAHDEAIRATEALDPLSQAEHLVSLFGASGDDAPNFAAVLIGELILTRMRLAAADPKALCAMPRPSPAAAPHAS